MRTGIAREHGDAAVGGALAHVAGAARLGFSDLGKLDVAGGLQLLLGNPLEKILAVLLGQRGFDGIALIVVDGLDGLPLAHLVKGFVVQCLL